MGEDGYRSIGLIFLYSIIPVLRRGFFMRYKNVDNKFMAAALKQAAKGVGYTSPNPAVGCVIVKDGHIVGKGYHHKAGQPHAEILALHEAGDQAIGADIYVTLEPCCIYGKTPPCTDTLVKSGVKRVIIGTVDPNPKVNGQGVRILRDAGIEVATEILEDQCREIIGGYAKVITTGLPLVTIKFAQSLDGRIATKTGNAKWISSPESRKLAHKLRATHDAILIGAATANTDDPQLNVRQIKGHNPIRVVLTGHGNIKSSLRMYTDGQAQVLIVTTEDNQAKLKSLENDQVEIITIPIMDESLNLTVLLKKLVTYGINSVLIEGGGQVITYFIKQNLVDRMVMFVAPILIGEGLSSVGDLGIQTIDNARKLNNVKIKKAGPDLMLTGNLH
jgi:diaminohydroxyphosphoribosylaminopyrimidine deaminase / 5-amino-6-(5-phosphoribosylamino)uracil reductase